MFTLYRLTNTVSGTVYFGITKNLRQRLYSHKSSANRGCKSKIYDAIRSYGWNAFKCDVIHKFETRKECEQAEKVLIEFYTGKTYNLHPGGTSGFSMLDKSAEEVVEWKVKLRKARAGKKPALGMAHSEETKKLCGEHGKRRWDIYGRYPNDVLEYSFLEAAKKFGISKTHYYRLKKQAQTNALG